MGVVWKAENMKLERPVALKFVAADLLLGNEDIRRRSEKEAGSTAALDQPSVCHVYEIDEAGGHTFAADQHPGGAPCAVLLRYTTVASPKLRAEPQADVSGTNLLWEASFCSCT